MPKALAVDGFGIRPCDRQAATARFTLMPSRYERGSVILTSNKGFVKRGELPGGTVAASATLDRLPHPGHAPNVQSESCRLRSRRHAGFFSPHHLPGESPDNDSDTGSFLRRR